jgi:hypothetical protein
MDLYRRRWGVLKPDLVTCNPAFQKVDVGPAWVIVADIASHTFCFNYYSITLPQQIQGQDVLQSRTASWRFFKETLIKYSSP